MNQNQRDLMARKQSDPTTPGTVTARIQEDIIHMAGVVASLRKTAVPDYLSDILRPIVERDYKEEIRKAHGQIGGEPEPSKNHPKPPK